MVLDSHGEVAARICSILTEKGHLEADTIAETAMVPEKDTREVRFFVSSISSSRRQFTFFPTRINRFFTNFIEPTMSRCLLYSRASTTILEA